LERHHVTSIGNPPLRQGLNFAVCSADATCPCPELQGSATKAFSWKAVVTVIAAICQNDLTRFGNTTSNYFLIYTAMRPKAPELARLAL
jgi:hypothetical protein